MRRILFLGALLSVSAQAVIPSWEQCQRPELRDCATCVDVLGRSTGLPAAVDAARRMMEDPLLRAAYYARQDRDYEAVSYDIEPSVVTPTTVDYQMNPPVRLLPGQCVYLRIPAHLRDNPILFSTLGHRQLPGDETGWENGEDFGDKNPGLTSIQVNETNENGESRWRYWNGMSSGNFGAKFAERDRMEQEGLYEWYKYGHSDVATNTRSTGPLRTDAARICNVGNRQPPSKGDPVHIGNFGLKVHPGQAARYTEHNFAAGNAFGDSLTAEGRHYGSRGESLMLGYGQSSSPQNLPEGWQVGGGELSIPTRPGETLRSLELAIGDEREDGSPGWARLNAYVLRANGERVSIVTNENVPPAGVLVGTPARPYTMEAGDRVVIHAPGAFLMGVRLGNDN